MDEIKCIKNLSENLQRYKKTFNLSITQLADRTGLTPFEIRNMLEGRLKRINYSNVLRLATYFNCSPNALLGCKELDIPCTLVEYPEPYHAFYAERFKPIIIDGDEEYAACIFNAIHGFIEAHKLASGYYYEDANMKDIQNLNKENIEHKHFEFVKKNFFNKTEIENATNQIEDNDVSIVKMVGENIKKIRKLYQLSREDISLRTGLSVDCIYRIENGKNNSLNFQHIGKIATELPCTMDFLLGESCSPVADKSNRDVFYGLEPFDFFRKYVQIGQDLSYATLYMDEASQTILKTIIDNLNLMNKLRITQTANKKKKLSNIDIYIREQEHFRENHPRRGVTIRKRKYQEDK